jgi:hypothetical protein
MMIGPGGRDGADHFSETEKSVTIGKCCNSLGTLGRIGEGLEQRRMIQ